MTLIVTMTDMIADETEDAIRTTRLTLPVVRAFVVRRSCASRPEASSFRGIPVAARSACSLPTVADARRSPGGKGTKLRCSWNCVFQSALYPLLQAPVFAGAFSLERN
jgi:hypothetical protein